MTTAAMPARMPLALSHAVSSGAGSKYPPPLPQAGNNCEHTGFSPQLLLPYDCQHLCARRKSPTGSQKTIHSKK